MNPLSRILLLAVATAAAGATLTHSAGVAEAQVYYGPAPRTHVGVVVYPRGLYVGGGLVATRILRQDGGNELLDHGGGLTLYSGIRINQSLALELGWVGTLHNPERVRTVFGDDVDYLVLNAFTGDAKIYLDTSSDSAEPFLQGGVGLYLLDSEYFGTQSVGTGFQLGGGVDFRVGDPITLGLRALYRGMAMGPPDRAYNDTFVSALTAEANLTIQF